MPEISIYLRIQEIKSILNVLYHNQSNGSKCMIDVCRIWEDRSWSRTPASQPSQWRGKQFLIELRSNILSTFNFVYVLINWSRACPRSIYLRIQEIKSILNVLYHNQSSESKLKVCRTLPTFEKTDLGHVRQQSVTW